MTGGDVITNEPEPDREMLLRMRERYGRRGRLGRGKLIDEVCVRLRAQARDLGVWEESCR